MDNTIVERGHCFVVTDEYPGSYITLELTCEVCGFSILKGVSGRFYNEYESSRDLSLINMPSCDECIIKNIIRND